MPRASTDTLWAKTADRMPGLAESLEATVREQARRNELSMAWVRCMAIAVTVAINTFATMSDPAPGLVQVPPINAYVSAAWLVIAVSLLVALVRGWYRRWLRFLLPVTDAIGMTLLFWLLYDTTNNSGELELLANMTAVCAILAASGGMRLSRAAVWVAIVSALTVLVVVGVTMDKSFVTILYLTCMVSGAGFVGLLMSNVVRKTARTEVENVILHRLLPATAPGHDHDDPLALIEPRSLRATVLVTDLRGFTARAETMSPGDLLEFLNQYQGVLATTVRQNGGVVDKFMGDGMLAVFGALDLGTDHAAEALCAAREMLVQIAAINAARPDGEEIRIGIGVHTGDVVVGCIGSGARLELTVIGDTVNTATRLEGHTKAANAAVIVSDETFAAVRDAELKRGFEPTGELEISGRAQPLEAHGLRGM